MTCPGERQPGKVEPAAYQPPNGLGPVMVLMRLGPCLEQGRKPVEDGDQE